VREVEVVGVRVEMPANQPIVLLKELTGPRYVPIWIGAVEATAIAFAQEGVHPPRPLTHDLFRDVLQALEVSLRSIRITELNDGVFLAELVLDDGVVVSARPSDAIALALRTDAAIFCADEVLAEVGIEVSTEEGEGGEVEEQQLEQFREFLDHVTPEDFER
jgi:uncharacterized protein